MSNSRLPTILARREHGETGVALDLRIPPDLLWFQGHFPGLPILPGVVQVDWAVELARTLLGLDLVAAPQFQVKFKAVIRPDDRLTLILIHDEVKGRLALEYRRGDEICCVGQVFLK